MLTLRADIRLKSTAHGWFWHLLRKSTQHEEILNIFIHNVLYFYSSQFIRPRSRLWWERCDCALHGCAVNVQTRVLQNLHKQLEEAIQDGEIWVMQLKDTEYELEGSRERVQQQATEILHKASKILLYFLSFTALLCWHICFANCPAECGSFMGPDCDRLIYCLTVGGAEILPVKTVLQPSWLFRESKSNICMWTYLFETFDLFLLGLNLVL